MIGIYFVELETNKLSKYQQLLVSKILSILCSNALVERIFNLMLSHWIDTKNVDLIRAELQVKVK